MSEHHGAPPTAPVPDGVDRIFLIGPMGSGKTTVGRHLADALSWQFIDCDHELEARCGVTIATIFEYESETGFRDRESRLLDELTQRPLTVLATGGGAALRETNRTWLKQRGLTIWLDISVKEQLRRLRRDRSRPLLQRPDREQTLNDMREQRTPFYRETAHVHFVTNRNASRNVSRRILKYLEEN